MPKLSYTVIDLSEPRVISVGYIVKMLAPLGMSRNRVLQRLKDDEVPIGRRGRRGYRYVWSEELEQCSPYIWDKLERATLLAQRRARPSSSWSIADGQDISVVPSADTGRRFLGGNSY